MTERQLFGTDGIRGEANVHPMTIQVAMRLGQSIAHTFRRLGQGKPRVIIGKDTRLSGYLFETAITAGVASIGAEAWQVGVLPTPGIAYITGAFRAEAGVVISASHNSFQDNGLKVFGGDGFKLPDAVEAQMERLMAGDELDGVLARGADVGRAFRIEDALGRYVTYLKGTFPRELDLDGVKVVVDCANGAAYKVAPLMLQELGATVVQLGTSPNGTNINAGNGALHPERMAETVRAVGAQLGIALDGDADRVILCDEKGTIVDGDHIMAVCAARMKAAGTLRHDTVVSTVMSNLGLEVAMRRLGIQLVRTAVGDRYVVEEMRRGGFNLGGEQSGHLLFLDHSTTGDGCLSALQVLAVVLREGRPLSELSRIMERYPQVLLNLQVRERRPIESLGRVQASIRGVEAALGTAGRVLVRYSGTEPKVRIMIEGEDRSSIQAYAEEIAAAFRTEIG
ncbi:MAG: phosphoglucosamine mutase [Myxococcales bacterium]